MTLMYKSARQITLGGMLLLLSSSNFLVAQEEKTAEKPASDRYTIPAGDDVAALVQFIDQLSNFQPGSQQEFDEYREKALPSLQGAADRVIQLEKDKSSPAYRTGQRTLLQLRLINLPQLGAKEQEALLDEVIAFLGDKEDLPVSDLGVAVQAARSLDQISSPLAVKAFNTFGKLLAKHPNEEVAEYGKFMLDSATRKSKRLNLLGSVMEIKGTTVDGKKFDLAALKGKVVLVDFWATWCGPCIAEFPNIVAAYDRYRDQGFEVVGISLDQDREALDRYLSTKEVSWITLHENEGQHPAAVEYEVNSIPFMVLIDREGKVISTEARGEELNRLLAEQFAGKK
jgi:thiol-disulfide isomerase/thioredoxin